MLFFQNFFKDHSDLGYSKHLAIPKLQFDRLCAFLRRFITLVHLTQSVLLSHLFSMNFTWFGRNFYLIDTDDYRTSVFRIESSWVSRRMSNTDFWHEISTWTGWFFQKLLHDSFLCQINVETVFVKYFKALLDLHSNVERKWRWIQFVVEILIKHSILIKTQRSIKIKMKTENVFRV